MANILGMHVELSLHVDLHEMKGTKVYFITQYITQEFLRFYHVEPSFITLDLTC